MKKENCMEKGIGELLTKLRKEAGYTQSQLCKGLYSLSTYARIETDQSEPGYFELDRLFERMGKSTDRIEYILPLDVYELYELQYYVQRAICHRDMGEAEKVLYQYGKRKQAKQPLHRQYICQETAQLLWLKAVSEENAGRQIRADIIEEILRLIEEAIVQTMDSETCLKDGGALSAEELRLLLFRWEVSRKSPYARGEEELEEVIQYLKQNSFEETELAKVYPYAVLLFVEQKKEIGDYDRCCYLLRTALEVLRNTGRVLYMAEILNAYAEVLKRGNEDVQKIQELESQNRSLLALEEEADIHLQNYRLFHNWNRSFELDYELIRQERIAGGYVQAELAEGICEPETLSRIESGKRKPNRRNMEAMMEKMQRERKRVSMKVAVEQYHTLELERKITVCNGQKEYEKASELIEELENRIDMSKNRNKQYVGMKKLICLNHFRKIDVDEYILQLNNLLALTLTDREHIFEHCLTETEKVILNLLACAYEKKQEVDKAFLIWEELIRKCEGKRVHPVFNIRSWELMTGNYVGVMETYGILDEAVELCPIWAEKVLSVGKGGQIGRMLSIKACVLEKQNDERCIERFHQALDILKLMKNTYRYNCNREYLKEKGILEKVEAMGYPQYYHQALSVEE